MAAQSFTDFATNSANPYYLHPNENPTLVLISSPLDDKNYHTWSRSMQIALISKNKDKFINDTLPKPSVSDVLYAPWIRCNTMVLAWIQCSISAPIARSVLWIDIAASVWKNLHIRFSHSDIFRISDIQEDLYMFRQGTLDVSNYFTHLKVLWDELETYHPIPSCSYAIPCSCGASESIRRYRDQDYVIRFLKGLNEKFTHSKSQIMMMNPLPDIDKTFSLVIQQEREMNHANPAVIPSIDNSEESIALSVSHDVQPNKFNSYKGKYQGTASSRGQNRVCTHCGRNNHTIDTCFIKHGYPPGFKHKSKGNGFSSQQSATANTASEVTASGSSSNNSSYGLTQEQYNNILALLQHSQPVSTTNSVSTSPIVLNSLSSNANGKPHFLWILDTGATDHISFNLSAFNSYHNIVPISVTLPNGSQLSASISGSVKLTPSLTLHNVLYIPSFNVNLISVAKLSQSNNCSVQFNSNSCSIMQNPSMETIGIADLQNGLYVLHSNLSPPSCNFVSTDGNIWHMRPGHPSHKGLQTIAEIFPFVSCNDNVSPCDSCHFAKQRKLPFPDSITCTNEVFNILHADLWGLFSTVSMLGHKYFLTLVDDHSRFTWVIFLKTKAETRDSFINFVACVEKQFNKHVKCLKSDNGAKFLALNSFLSAKGILHQKSCVETPQQNGIVERKHQHILNVSRAMHFQSNVPLTMWNFCVQQAIHIINRLPTPLLKLKCPYEILYQEHPSLMHLKVFGCLCYATSLMAHRTKFDPRARKAVFIGYKEGTKGYIMYDLTHHSIFVSRHVIFYENTFPFKSRTHSQDRQSSAPNDSTNPAFTLCDDTVPSVPSDKYPA